MSNLFPIIFEDKCLLVLNKPAGLVCHPTKGDAYSSLVGRVGLYLGRTGHLINRLDRETSGIVVVAKNAETAAALGTIWASRVVKKSYLAIVHGNVKQPEGFISASLGKDVRSEVAIKYCVRDDGAVAQSYYVVENRFVRQKSPFSLLKVQLLTGRKHQIRIHLAHIGHPIVGDKLYGGNEQIYLDFVKGRLTANQRRSLILEHQALHASHVVLPVEAGSRTFEADPEPAFKEFAGLA